MLIQEYLDIIAEKELNEIKENVESSVKEEIGSQALTQLFELDIFHPNVLSAIASYKSHGGDLSELISAFREDSSLKCEFVDEALMPSISQEFADVIEGNIDLYSIVPVPF